MDLTLFQLKGNVIIGDDAWEPLRNVEHFDGVIRFQVNRPPSVLMARRVDLAGTETIFIYRQRHIALTSSIIFSIL